MTMNKEWKAELRGLLKQKRTVINNSKLARREVNKRKCELEKHLNACHRELRRQDKVDARALARVDARIAVLEGRLAA
jgi:hypothetical protein